MAFEARYLHKSVAGGSDGGRELVALLQLRFHVTLFVCYVSGDGKRVLSFDFT